MNRFSLTYLLYLSLGICIFTGLTCRKSDYYVHIQEEVIRDLGYGTGTVTWANDRTYILEGFVFVNDGKVLYHCWAKGCGVGSLSLVKHD